MNRVVVSFADGKKKVGRLFSFNTQKSTFPLEVETSDGRPEVHTIKLEEVKKIAFRKKNSASASGVNYETIDQSRYAGPIAFRLTIEFQDGELIVGSAIKYDPEDKGFFLIPLNPGDRNERIYVNCQHIKAVDQKRLFGKQLLDTRQISEYQLNEALRIQSEQRVKKIGSIMLEETMINESQLKETLSKQKERNIKLGELLFESGYITQKQLNKALSIQKDYQQKKLGQILVGLRYLTPNDICLALASQLGCAWVDLNTMDISPDIISLIPEDAIKAYQIFPVTIKDFAVLVIASAQPLDTEMQRNLRAVADYNIEFVVAYDGYIAKLIQRHFPDKS